MRLNKKKIVITTIILIALILSFLFKNGLSHTKLQLTRIFNTISYSMEDQLAGVLYSNEHIKIPLKFHRQEHALTCETASLRMALNYLGAPVTEDELLEKLPFDTTEPKSYDNIWGDPDKGFVGSVDGSITLGTGYGVYEEPIRDLASDYKPSLVMRNADLSQVLTAVDRGHPVIVWGLLSHKDPINWQTEGGKSITAFIGEHARVVIGFSGDISNPKKIVLMDPIYGRIRMNTKEFLLDWETLNNRAVVIF